MDLLPTSQTTNFQSLLSTSLKPVFSDNVQDLLGVEGLQVNPSAIITVNSIADVVDNSDGVTTLREAISQANADAGEDLIVFDRSLFASVQTISLSKGELDITHNLSIIAPRDSLTGGDLLTVSGNNATRVFEIETGATVNLSGLIVANGNVTNDEGGGIQNSGILTLDNSIVRNNSAKFGGGIFNNNGASLIVSNSTVSRNTAIVGSNEGEGGGIYNSNNGIVVVSNNSTISGNSANAGGGIYNSNSATVRLSNSTISGSGVSGRGGGIYNSGTVEMSNSTISGNSARGNGGGINNSDGANLAIGNSSISGNSALRGSGGGINNTGAPVFVSNSTISGNFGFLGGGGISNSGILTVSNSTLSGNSGKGSGGGISNGGTSTVSNSTISGNLVSLGSGGGIDNGGTLTVSNSTISSNSVSSEGGGIYNEGTVTLVFSTLTLNKAANGGGVYNASEYMLPFAVYPPGAVSLRNTIIASNLLSENGVNPDVAGSFTSDRYNLIGDGTGSNGFDATGDIVGTSDKPIDPLLASLDFNGGSTQTIALLPDSPAINAGDPTMLPTDPKSDQRGNPRVSGGRSDIGAFEFSLV